MKLQQAIVIFEMWLKNEESIPTEKVKEAAAFIVERFVDTGRPEHLCTYCEKEVRDCYVLKDEIWKIVHPSGYRGHLHLKCAEQLLGRELCSDDFRPDVPVNAGVLHVLERFEM